MLQWRWMVSTSKCNADDDLICCIICNQGIKYLQMIMKYEFVHSWLEYIFEAS